MNEEINKLPDKDFIKILSIINSLAKTISHRYSVPKDSASSYLLEVFAENKQEIQNWYINDEINYLKNYLLDEGRKKLGIYRVTLKDSAQHTYKLSLVVTSIESTGKYDILGLINEELSKIFTIEYSKLKGNIQVNSKGQPLIEIEIKGKPSPQFREEEVLYIELEKRINLLGIIKLTSLGIQINKRARVSIDNHLQYIDFSDELIEPDCKKSLFYNNIKEFDLNQNEENYVNLCFKGYNPNSDLDLPLFQEAIKSNNGKDIVSKGYLRKAFLDRLCKKLTENSPFID